MSGPVPVIPIVDPIRTTDCLIRLFPCEHQRSRTVEALRALDADAVRQLGVGVAALETATLATAA